MTEEASSTGPDQYKGNMILLSRPIELDSDKIQRSFVARHPGIDICPATKEGNAWRIGSHNFIILNLPRPLPAGWETISRRANTFWPNAIETCSLHRAHLNLIPIDKHRDLLSMTCYATALTDAIVQAYPEVLAVMWNSGAVMNSREDWSKLGTNALAPEPPLTLWIGIHAFRDAANNGGYFTLGLTEFVGREIEIETPRNAMAETFNVTAGLCKELLSSTNLRNNLKVQIF